MSTANLYQVLPLVLVVEDNKSMRMLLRRAMEQDGYQVAEAGTESKGWLPIPPKSRYCPVGCPDAGDGWFTCCAQLQTL